MRRGESRAIPVAARDLSISAPSEVRVTIGNRQLPPLEGSVKGVQLAEERVNPEGRAVHPDEGLAYADEK
jgi:hypothetical protein